MDINLINTWEYFSRVNRIIRRRVKKNVIFWPIFYPVFVLRKMTWHGAGSQFYDDTVRGEVTGQVCILGQKSKSEFFKTDSLQAFFKMLTHRGKIIFLQKKGLYEACSIPHSELSKVTLQIIFYFWDTLGHH